MVLLDGVAAPILVPVSMDVLDTVLDRLEGATHR